VPAASSAQVIIRRHAALGRVDANVPRTWFSWSRSACDQPARIPSLSASRGTASSQIGSFATSGTMTRVFRAAGGMHRPASGSTSAQLIARVHS